MPIIFKTLKAGTLLSGSSSTVFTPASGESYIVSNIRLFNNSSVTVTVTSIAAGPTGMGVKPRLNPAAMTLSAGTGAVFNSAEITLDSGNVLDISASNLPAATPGLNYALSGVQKV